MVKYRRGFTIIEVALVLAVAGMIMLAVFIALPAVQRTERDAERQEDLAEIIRGIKSYQSNNRGALPNGVTAWKKFYSDYLPKLTEPNGQGYFDNFDDSSLVVCNSATGAACAGGSQGDKIASFMNNDFEINNYRIMVVTQATCNGNEPIKSSNVRKVALLYTLEIGGVVCRNS